jgi:hypothetical protein
MNIMKKIIFISIFFLFYMFLTYICSYYSDLYQGFSLGYPVFYYEFYTNPTEKQWGTNPLNFIINLLIVIVIYIFIQKIWQYKR